VRVGGRQLAIRQVPDGDPRRPQILVQIVLLIGQIEAQPFGENLVVIVAECAIGDLPSGGLDQRGMGVQPGLPVAQGAEENQPSKPCRNLGKNSPADLRYRTAR